MFMRDGISAKERVRELGLHNELKLNYYIDKSKRIAKLKKMAKKIIINTQKKEWN